MSTPQFILFSIIRIESVNNKHGRRVKRQQSGAFAFLVYSNTEDTDYVLMVSSDTARGSLRHLPCTLSYPVVISPSMTSRCSLDHRADEDNRLTYANPSRLAITF